MPANTLYRRNIYSEELLKTLYIDPGRAFDDHDHEACDDYDDDGLDDDGI